MSFEKRGKHSVNDKVESYKLGRHRCMLCDAEFDIISGKVHSCPDCKAEQSSVVCIEEDIKPTK
jgi:hypothetical protein